eukprot:TRINITY_DN18919_c0_g1_i1.p1 TRINITY_DN18919_c0_g1~~TRINITY_DN18919_c0_g1_i1.p1  ORF type:complete len:203 (-),score=12.67 TRINITY_DN18919_c0_g1_i1:221-787(-)
MLRQITTRVSLCGTLSAPKSVLNHASRPAVFNMSRSINTISMTEEEQTRQNLARSRPVSPHVTIYKFPLPAISSITNRITGVSLYVGISAAALSALVSPAALPAFLACVKSSPLLLPLVKGTVAFPFVYHTAAGIRHLIWDQTGKGFELPEIYKSSQLLFAVTAVFTLLLAFISFKRPCIDAAPKTKK